MTDADLDFTVKTKPSHEQVRFVWNQMVGPTCRKVATELQKRGGKISYKTVQRYHRDGWVKPQKGNGNTRQVPLQKSGERKKGAQKLNNEARAKIPAMTPEQRAMAKTADINEAKGPMTQEEKDLFVKLFNELFPIAQADLVARAKKAHLICLIMAMETAAKRADLMILVSGDLARLLHSSTEAIHHMSGEPDPEPAKKLHGGNGHDMIDVTPPTSSLSSAIAAFKRKQGVAA